MLVTLLLKSVYLHWISWALINLLMSSGIGAIFQLCPRNGSRMVRAVAEGSTAQLSGLREGDVIEMVTYISSCWNFSDVADHALQVDGFPVDHMDNAEFGSRIMGPQV